MSSMNCSIILCIVFTFTFVYGQWSISDGRKRKHDESIEPTWHWLELPLDHFDVLDNRTFNARYLTNDQFYKKGGPIIVYIGGEWEIADYGVMGGMAFQLAKQHNGYLFYPEHRYFGRSNPFPKPVSTEDLKYITPDFSIADLAYSTTHLKETVDGLENSQVVLLGGSYAGALAIWARLKYPHIMSMAYNCGGVVKTETENSGYFRIVENVYKNISPTCLDIIIASIDEVEQVAKTEEGSAKLVEDWTKILCFQQGERFTLPQKIVQAINFQVAPVYNALQFCHFIETNTTGSPLARLHQSALTMIGTNKTCEDENEKIDREWWFLVCTFLGNIQTTTESRYGNLQVLARRLKRLCTEQFGPQMTPEFVNQHVKRATTFYGSATPDVTKVLSVQGTHDPWRSGSILDDLNDETPVVYIEGATHCLEIGEEQYDETPQVSQAKLEILHQLSKWIV